MRKSNRKCSVKGCDRKHDSKGYCLSHYKRFRKGRPVDSAIRKCKRNKPNFHDNYEKITETGCWIWIGPCFNEGYGWFFVNGKPIGAHRVSWELHNGPIPDGMYVLHTCDVRPCVNPDHLFIGTQKDNIHDAIKKGRMHWQKWRAN